MSHSQDPRFEGTSRYVREEVNANITEFYQFLAKFPVIEPDDILKPPKQGWPEITAERLAPLSKSEEVIQLLAHLPYLSVNGHEAMAAPSTHMIDYRGPRFLDALATGRQDAAGWNYVPPFVDLPPHVVTLTAGRVHGDFLLLDTSDGQSSPQTVQSASFSSRDAGES